MAKTYYHRSTTLASSVHAATHEVEQSLTQGSSVTTLVSANHADGADTLAYLFNTVSGEPGSADWESGDFQCVIDCTAAGADMVYGLLTLGGSAGHFARVGNGLTSDLDTRAQIESAFSGTGLKVATTGAWDSAAGATLDRFECLIAAQRTATGGHGNQTITIEVDDPGADPGRSIWDGEAAPPTFTGSASPTQEDDTSAVSGTFTPPTFIGSASSTQEADTSIASGTFTNPTLTGSAVAVEEDDTSTASGSFTAPVFTGSASPTQAADTSTASGAFTPPTFTGTASPTQQADTSTASGVRWDYAVFRRTPQTGAVFDPDVDTPLARTVPNLYTDVGPAENDYDYQVFGWSGTWTSGSEVVQIIVAGSFTGSGSPTQADDTSTATGTFTNPTLTGSAAATQDDNTSTASGTFVAPTVTGSGIPTQADQTSTASGTFTSGTFTGSAAVTQQSDTGSATGTFTSDAKVGVGSPIQEDDTSTASGTFTPGPVTGSAAPTQQDDTAAASGSFTAPAFTGTLAAFQDAQTGLGMGTFSLPTFTGSATVTQEDQTSTASGTRTALTFWAPAPVAYTSAGVAYSPLGPNDPPPW
jgi:hypothetical protein